MLPLSSVLPELKFLCKLVFRVLSTFLLSSHSSATLPLNLRDAAVQPLAITAQKFQQPAAEREAKWTLNEWDLNRLVKADYDNSEFSGFEDDLMHSGVRNQLFIRSHDMDKEQLRAESLFPQHEHMRRDAVCIRVPSRK